MPATGFATALGTCRVEWGAAGIHRVRLPGPGITPGADPPPPGVQAAINAMVQLLATGQACFDDVALDLQRGSEFERAVWALARQIPAGRTRTYGELAQALGQPQAARAVGVALGRNPVPLLVPCHRVLGAGARLVGFSAPGGTTTKQRLLAIEQARVGDEPQLF